MKLSKENQRYKRRAEVKKGFSKEASIQKFVDDYLKIKQIDYIRIPDALWSFIKRYAPPGIQAIIARDLAGWSDNIPFVKITDKFFIGCFMENKSFKGKLHGKQKTMSDRLNYQIIRTPEDAMELIEELNQTAEKLKEYMSSL